MAGYSQAYLHVVECVTSHRPVYGLKVVEMSIEEDDISTDYKKFNGSRSCKLWGSEFQSDGDE